jgi:hypothetical protein
MCKKCVFKNKGGCVKVTIEVENFQPLQQEILLKLGIGSISQAEPDYQIIQTQSVLG